MSASSQPDLNSSHRLHNCLKNRLYSKNSKSVLDEKYGKICVICKLSSNKRTLELIALFLNLQLKVWKLHSKYYTTHFLLWKDLVKKIFSFPFLLEVGLCSLLYQVLQVIGILFHSGQQVIENTGAAFSVEKKTTNIRHLLPHMMCNYSRYIWL